MANLVSDAGILGEGLFDQSRTRGQLVSSTPGAITRIDAVPNVSAGIIDVGAGASTLVDDLLQLGYTDVTVLDNSGAALNVAKQRLGEASRSVRWKCADVTRADLAPGQFDLWHDRAVFHLSQSSKSDGIMLQQWPRR